MKCVDNQIWESQIPLRRNNLIKNWSTEHDLYIHLTDWFGTDTLEYKKYLSGRHLQTNKNDYEDSDSDSEEEDLYQSEYLVYAFGLNDLGNSVAVKITDFKPYFFIKVPDNWKTFQVDILIEYLRKKAWPAKFKHGLYQHELIRAKPLYGFTADDQFNYVKLTFHDHEAFRKWSYMFRRDIKVYGLNGNRPHKYDLYESNIDPLIRLTHIKEISPSGWIRLPASEYTVVSNDLLKQTHCQLEVAISYQNIQAIDRSDISPIVIAAYDIEADSSHGDFPLAKKDYQKLAQDIITAYVKLSTDHDPILLANPREVLERWVQLAFDDLYQNYNIHHIVADKPSETQLDNVVPEAINICQQYFQEPDDSIKKLHNLFEFNLPLIDLESEHTSHYGLLATQICKDYAKLHSKNDRLLSDPHTWMKYVISLAFDPYFDGHEINRVYTKNNKKPAEKKISNMIPQIFKICCDCNDFVERKAKLKKDKASGSKKTADEEETMTQDLYVEELKEFLNKYLPPVEGDITIQIGTTYQRYGEKHPFLKHIITLDTCLPIDREKLIADEHKDIEFPTRELIKGLQTIKKALEKDTYHITDPELRNIIVDSVTEESFAYLSPEIQKSLNQCLLDFNCHNQLQEDNSLVVVESYSSEREVLLAWTRLIQTTDPDVVIGYNIFGFDFKFLWERSVELGCMQEFTQLGRFKDLSQGIKEQSLSSSGLGDNYLYYIPMFGRVIADLYKIVQAGHKLPMYNLNYVSKHFMFMSKNDLPPSKIFIMQKGDAADRQTIAEYCLVDCVLCNRLLNKLDIITNNIGMSNVCRVPLSYLFLRGQSVKILSLVARECRLEGYLIPVLESTDEDDDFEGAIVLEPEKDIYFEPVVVADFNSLYPSCIIAENLSHDSYVTIGSKYDNLPNYRYENIEYDLYREEEIPGRKKTIKVKCGVETCRFVQLADGKKSLLPRILMNLLQARKDTRKDQKAYPKGSFQWAVKEGLQLAYKITANSLYGQLGYEKGKIYFKQLAACTTASGRKLIYQTKDFFEKHYPGARAVYGDTDSVFIKFDCKNAAGEKLYGLDAIYKSIELCIEGSLAISRQLKAPHNLEFEKAIWPFILLSKKRYHGHYYTNYGNPSYYANSMGIVLKRRDNAMIVKHIFGSVVDIIMKEHDINKAMETARNMAYRLLEGEYPLDMFTVTKTLKSYYKNPMQIAHNVLAQRIGKRDPGNRPQANDRIAYAYVKIPGEKTKGVLQGERIETPEFIRENNLEIDYKFYLTNQIMLPVSQIFELVTNDLSQLFEDPMRDYDYKKQGIRKLTEWYTIKKK